jgi:xanthine dehydrogenase YagS FAD-binding subunit
MNNFDYARASNVADAVRMIAADPAAKFIAGGTNLVDLMKENVARPSRLIDITHLPLREVDETQYGGLRIGALSPITTSPITRRSRRAIRVGQQVILAGVPRNCAIRPRPAATFRSARCPTSDTTTPCNNASWPAAARDRRLQSYARDLGASEHCVARIPPTCA